MTEKLKYRRRLLVTGATAAAIGLTALTVPVANAADQNPADSPGYTVEPAGTIFEAGYTVDNGVHPGAELIAAQSNILLKDGNGQITYTACNRADSTQIFVESKVREGSFICFATTGQPGWLKMEIPGSFGVRAGNKELTVTTVEGSNERQEVTIKLTDPRFKNIDPKDTTEVTLVELRTK